MSKYDENDCRFIGTLGKDIEIKYAQSGVAIANFSIACSKSVKKGDTWENKSEWVPVVAFGKVAENVANKASKGSVLRVIGEFTTSNYEKDGHKVYKSQIVSNMIKIISGSKEVFEQQDLGDAATSDDSPDLPF